MFEYKDKAFYNEYFSSLPDFKLTQEFLAEDGEDKKYVGKMETVNTVHPISIQIEIPKNFPHGKMLFWTGSLLGYPHLIQQCGREDSWFCLNTSFAETAEEQLAQEMSRLRVWFKKYLRKDLPAIIKDSDVRYALRVSNAYSWENPDEMNEYKQDVRLTFIGDFASKADSFKEKKGKFHCVKNGSNRIFALRNEAGTNFELPYIIVDQRPYAYDFVSMKEQYGWDEDICEFLLPGLHLGKIWDDKAIVDMVCYDDMTNTEDYPEDEAIQILNTIEQELQKDEPRVKSKFVPFEKGRTIMGYSKKGIFKEHVVPDVHKALLKKNVRSLREDIKKEHGYKCPYNDLGIFSTEDDADYYEALYNHEEEMYKLHGFALGITYGDSIDWVIVSTNKVTGEYGKVVYDIILCSVTIWHLVSKMCNVEMAQIVTEKEYFGRGQFSSVWKGRKVCVVGAGALGSQVCESLARSGVGVLSIWDDDIVEPGNICRSTYQTRDLGDSKIDALKKHIVSINPFVDICEIKTDGNWHWKDGHDGCCHDWNNLHRYTGGSFYGNINYNSQEESIKLLNGYDLIIDCTGSNELLHFMSYAMPEKELLSMCITNHANNLLMFSSNEGNPYEQRKMYLSKIEQDTENFYVEGSGCYSPTFLATYSDITALVCLAMKEINARFEQNDSVHSVIWSYAERGIVADRIKSYGLSDSKIRLLIPTETLMDGEEMLDASDDGVIGFLLGGYSTDGTMVMVSHIIGYKNAREQLDDAFKLSNGVVDYLGDFVYSDAETGGYKPEHLKTIKSKAADKSVNVNNPVLVTRNLDGSLSFYLYLAGKLELLMPLN